MIYFQIEKPVVSSTARLLATNTTSTANSTATSVAPVPVNSTAPVVSTGTGDYEGFAGVFAQPGQTNATNPVLG